MVFQIQPSNKGRKKALSRRRKQGSTFAAHQDALDADPDQPPDTANDPTAASSHPASQNRKYRIEAVQALEDERLCHAGKIEKQKSDFTKERRGHALVIDHLHEQWKERMAATTLRMRTQSTSTTAKAMKRIEEKTEKKNAKEREKLTNKLERKEDQLETVIGVNKKR